jgi:hypothetical protein
MILYHFTQPANLFHIALDGLEPSAQPNQEFMTGNVPVVWLTREESNVAKAEDIAHFQSMGHSEFKVGGLLYGGKVRLAVELSRADKRLFRYLDFCTKMGADAAKIRPLLTSKSANSWWVYTGMIAPHKIDMGVPRAVALECLDHHIATHPDVAVRAKFKLQREQVAKDTSIETVNFSIS